MPNHIMVPASGRVWKPWKNGGGEMADVVVSPAGAGLEEFKWRIAIAKIEKDGPFSNFPGIDRTFMVVGGKGVTLMVEGMEPARLTHKSMPFLFPGDKPTSAKLIDGPAHALNVMARRDTTRTRVGLADSPAQFVVGGEALAVLVWARGRADVKMDDEIASVGQHDAIVFAAGTEVKIKPADHSHGWLVEIWSGTPTA